MKKDTGMPQWLLQNESYNPPADKDKFIDQSILSIIRLLSRIKAQEGIKASKYQMNATLKVAFTVFLLILLSISKSFVFVRIVIVYQLCILSIMRADQIIKVIKAGMAAGIFTFFIMLPSVLTGNVYSCVMITSKAVIAVMAVTILSCSTRWSNITGALHRFFIPDLFILVLDITIKYIVILGDLSLNMFYALKLKSVGKNRNKYTSVSGIAGTMFIKSREMADDVYQAMICRGFTGQYRMHGRQKLGFVDFIYIIINITIFSSFLYFAHIG